MLNVIIDRVTILFALIARVFALWNIWYFHFNLFGESRATAFNYHRHRTVLRDYFMYRKRRYASHIFLTERTYNVFCPLCGTRGAKENTIAFFPSLVAKGKYLRAGYKMKPDYRKKISFPIFNLNYSVSNY